MLDRFHRLVRFANGNLALDGTIDQRRIKPTRTDLVVQANHRAVRSKLDREAFDVLQDRSAVACICQ